MVAMSAVSSIVGASTIDPSSLFAIATAAPARTRKTFETCDFPHPFADRLGANATPARACRYVVVDVADGRALRALADRHVILDAGARRQHHEVAERHAAR